MEMELCREDGLKASRDKRGASIGGQKGAARGVWGSDAGNNANAGPNVEGEARRRPGETRNA